MPTLTPLAAGHGFTAGDLDTGGQVAVVPAYQKVYFADGRETNSSGYHKLDFINTKLTGSDASAAFTKGEIITQTTSGAKGIYDECTDVILTGTPSGTFTIGEKVTQASSNAVGFVIAIAGGYIDVCPVGKDSDGDLISFVTGQVVTGAVSAKTITPSAVSTAGKGLYHFVYRTTTTEFDTTNVITGADSGSTLTVSAVTAPPHWLNWVLTDGIFPDGGSDIMALCFGRIFMNSMFNPHQWFATRIGNPLDLLLAEDDVASAVNSQATGKAGLVGKQLIAIIPHKDNMAIFGCLNRMFVMRADPRRGGFFATLSDTTGIFSNTSYCWDDKNNFYWLGNDGLYVSSYGAMIGSPPSPPINLTKEHLPKLVSQLALNRGTDRVTMAYDKDRYGIVISISQQDGQWKITFWVDLRTGGVFPDKYASEHVSSSLFYFDARKKEERTLLAGTYGGYIYKWDETVKSDEGGLPIESYALIGPLVATQIRGKITLDELSVRTGLDTDRLKIAIYAATTANKLINDVNTLVTPKVLKEFTVDKLLPSLRQPVTDGAIGIKLSNTESASSWSIEKIDANISEIERIK